MVIFKEIENKNDLNEVINNSNPDVFYNLKINLIKDNDYSHENLKLVDYVANNFDLFKKNVKFINLYVPFEKIPKKEFIHILNLHNKTSKYVKSYINVDHRYFDHDDFYLDRHIVPWEIKTIIKANVEINKVCDFIKENKFSPFEALAYIHNYVSTVANYNISNLSEKSWYASDQFFAGVFKDIPEVVCAGYSSLMKEIIDNLDMPGLKCDMVSVDLKHLKKEYTARHSRCLIKIKDDRYGLDQTMFDDPTWDNDKKANCSKYCHFAMKNDTHNKEISKLYYYYEPFHFDLDQNRKATSRTRDLNTSSELYNKSKNQIDQKMIETAYVRVMQKTCKDVSPNDIYLSLKQMARESYKEQLQREYCGNLTQSKPVLERKDVFKLCGNEKLKKNAQNSRDDMLV